MEAIVDVICEFHVASTQALSEFYGAQILSILQQLLEMHVPDISGKHLCLHL
jgi:hypothetical protein